MVLKIELQPAWVLHSQPFQNTSLLVDFFCLELGRVRAIAKGARRPTAKNKALLQSFQPLLISLTGRNDLKTLTAVEISHAAIALQGTRLFSGLYRQRAAGASVAQSRGASGSVPLLPAGNHRTEWRS